jgi:hypothetical protein
MLLGFLYLLLKLFATEFDETEANVLKGFMPVAATTIAASLAALGKLISVLVRDEKKLAVKEYQDSQGSHEQRG